VPIVLKSGSHNLREPSGPVQACTGIASSFTLSFADTSRRAVEGADLRLLACWDCGLESRRG